MMKYVWYGLLVVICLVVARFVLAVGISMAPIIGLVILILAGLFAIGWVAEKVWDFIRKHKIKKDDGVIITPPPKEKEDG